MNRMVHSRTSPPITNKVILGSNNCHGEDEEDGKDEEVVETVEGGGLAEGVTGVEVIVLEETAVS